MLRDTKDIDMTEEIEEAATLFEVQEGESLVNITWNGMNGDLSSPVRSDILDSDIRALITSAVANGEVHGFPADESVDFSSFVLDRFPPTDSVPHGRIFLRPKCPYGA